MMRPLVLYTSGTEPGPQAIEAGEARQDELDYLLRLLHFS